MTNRRSICSPIIICMVIFVTGYTSKASAESALHYIDDATITAEIKEAIYADPILKILQIDVETTDGDVALSGSVDTMSQDVEAFEVASRINGVKAVADDLAIGLEDDD